MRVERVRERDSPSVTGYPGSPRGTWPPELDHLGGCSDPTKSLPKCSPTKLPFDMSIWCYTVCPKKHFHPSGIPACNSHAWRRRRIISTWWIWMNLTLGCLEIIHHLWCMKTLDHRNHGGERKKGPWTRSLGCHVSTRKGPSWQEFPTSDT